MGGFKLQPRGTTVDINLPQQGDFDEKPLKVSYLTDRELQEAQLVELRIISRKLDCLQPFDDKLDEGDLDELDNESI